MLVHQEGSGRGEGPKGRGSEQNRITLAPPLGRYLEHPETHSTPGSWVCFMNVCDRSLQRDKCILPARWFWNRHDILHSNRFIPYSVPGHKQSTVACRETRNRMVTDSHNAKRGDMETVAAKTCLPAA